MANLVLKSEQQILGDMISKVLAESGINDINAGSYLLTLLESAAAEDFEQYVQMVSIIRNFNLDTTTGEDLDNRAFEFGLTRKTAQKATGKITILRESTFVKVATTLFAGLPSPVAGDTILNVNDASNLLYGSSGVLIIGRGTSNEEEVAYSVAPVDNVNYWTFTIAPLANNHGLDETVILKQGTNVLINAGTVVRVPATGTSAEIGFSLNQDVTLLAGEDALENVEVTCSEAGTVGNIPINAIFGTDAFAVPPFSGARAQNDAKFTTGQDLETDDELRDRIKNHIQSLSRGTKAAVLNAVIGLLDPETAKRVVSASVVLPTTLSEIVKVFVDDGTGFEPSFDSEGFETVLAAATGGETKLQLDQFPLVKAQLESNTAEPFNMSAGSLTLIYNVGTQSETITFQISDFLFPNAATAEEIVTAINNKANLIEARTSQVGKKVVIVAKDNQNEELQITGGTANGIINFPTDQRSTLYLYVDDQLLSKDGSTAFLDSGNTENYNFNSLGASPWPLNVTVDGKTANPQVINFVPGDFANPLIATAEEVVAAINARLAGATATVVGNGTKVRITSNTELSADSKVHVTGGSANTLLGFSTVQVSGTSKQYTLNRFLGQIELASPLTANQTVTAGSLFTRAFFRSTNPQNYSVSVGQTLKVIIDGLLQTVTFPTTGSFTAAQIAATINSQLVGALASVRVIGGLSYLEVTTNSQDEATGSLQIDATSTATGLGLLTGVTRTNARPHRAYSLSGNVGPYTLRLNHPLVMILDNDPVTKTYSVMMDYDGTVTSGSSITQFSASALNSPFPTNNDLQDYYVVFQSGPNTASGSVASVSLPGGSTRRYNFASLPSGLANMAAGDHVTFSNLANFQNNGDFIITAVSIAGNGYVDVINASGVAETGASGTALIGQRRQITAHTGLTGAITVGSAFTAIPVAGNTFSVLPYTTKNVVAFLNNTKITPLSTKGVVEAATQGTKIQISSQSNGSDGYIQVTGGLANLIFGFSTSSFRGLQGYNYYTGLLKLIHRTIYGDDSDPVSYPGVGAAGIQFDILAPTVQEISFNITVTLKEGFSISNLTDQIKSAVTGYVNGLGVGSDVIVSEVVAAILAVDGITDVQINSPTTNVVIEDSELPRTRDSLIVLG